MVTSCITPPKRTARQCTHLTTFMRNMGVCLLRKNRRIFALTTGYLSVGALWMRIDCLRPRSARIRSPLTLASHGCMNTVFGPMAMSGLCRTQPQAILWRLSTLSPRKMLSSTTPKHICDMFAVAYYTLFLLAILAPVGAYCHLTKNNNNESENNNEY